MKIITFTKVRLPFGFLSNMSPHPIRHHDRVWRTAEALFQALRFNDVESKNIIWNEASPMTAKFKAKARKALMAIQPGSVEDLNNMKTVLRLKIAQHPDIKKELLATKDATIIEDCTQRRESIWGAQYINGNWRGQNLLGLLWMKLRDELNEHNSENDIK